MKRLLLLLLPVITLVCLVYAQIGDDAVVDESNPAIAQESLPEAAPQTTPIPADDSFLDDIIGSESITPPQSGGEPAAEETVSPAATEEPEAGYTPYSPSYYNTQQPQEPASTQQTAPAPVTRSVYKSSTPNIDESLVQGTPDIPLFSHRGHIEDVGAECVQCHQTLFAESVRGIKSGPSTKEICSQCHNGSDASAEVLAGFSDEKKYVRTHMPPFSHTTHMEHTEKCNSCHTDYLSDIKNIKTPPPMSNCTGCHNNRKANANCRVCHEDPSKLKPKSHTARWTYRNGHGTDARYNQAKCRECHVDRECNTCHRGQSSFAIHRPGYRYSHGMDARQRVSNCGYCHDAEKRCAQCHVRK